VEFPLRREREAAGVPGTGGMVRMVTYGLDINQIPRAMPELLTGRALKWFIANNKFWETWVEFIQSFQEFFLPRGFMTKLADQVRQRKQRHGENFKDYMARHPEGTVRSRAE